jgi:hypothetical protein
VTLLSTIITKAYRKSNIIPIGTVPTANEVSEALDILQQIVRSSIGVEAGGEFVDINVGGPYDESRFFPQWLPDNARLLLNISATTTFYLDPCPEDGQRLAIIDVLGTLGTYNLTLNGNGRNIEDASSITLSTNFMSSEWLYRADTGNWVKIQTLVSSDQMPFPDEFDDYFILSTNLQLASIHNQSITPENMELLKRGRRNIRSRYRNKKSVYPEYMGRMGERKTLLGENSNVFFRDF